MNTECPTFYEASQASLDSALRQALPDLPANRVARVRAAVAAFARMMQRPPDELPAHQGFIIHQMRRLRRGPTGLSLKTLSNTRSELIFLVRRTSGQGSRSALALSAEWAQFRDSLRHPPAWWSLSRLAAFSSQQGVTPKELTDAHVECFRKALQRSGEVADPIGHTRRIIRVWNKLAADHLALQIRPLTSTPQQRRRWTLPETEFPQSFRADVEAWFQRLSADDPFSSGPRRALRPSTIRTRRHQLFKAASALVFSGHPIHAIRSLADLVTVEAFRSALRHLLDRQNGKTTEALHGLAAGLLAVARHHVGTDRETEIRLATMVRNLDAGVSGFRSKTRTRLAAFEDDQLVAVLLGLPARLLADAQVAGTPRRRKKLAELAIAIEILTFAPMRISNVAALRQGTSLRRVTIGRVSRWIISIPAVEVKNRAELTYELPGESHDLIDKALTLYRRPEGWLFPGRKVGPKAASLLSAQIKRTVEGRLGVRFHVHMFRALAGYLHLKENPNGFEAVRALLGNRDDSVIRNNYAFLAERSLIAKAQAAIGQNRTCRQGPRKNKRRADS
jgi:integrase